MKRFQLCMTSRIAAAVIIAAAVSGVCKIVVAQDRPPDVQEGVQVLTRGPVHEAFAETVSFNPEPGLRVTKAPPPLIEEVPPDQRPEGANVAWISGYWAWDDERDDFLWVSGVWRVMPPGREWVSGYWGRSDSGFQWMSGYWADAQVSETVYFPEPPDSVEAGPNMAPPSSDHIWAPGCWVWHENRYAWRPGYWVPVHPDWIWVPSHYIYSPRGYVFCEGYWDYAVESRGVLFAPVYFESAVYARPAFHYSPIIVINLSIFTDHLFVRPSCHHYYFGDYYAPRYYDQGIYASFTFSYSRYGYDPIYVNERYRHRDDRDWDHHVRQTFIYRRDHEEARPPRTLAIQVTRNTTKDRPDDKSFAVATSFDQMAKSKDHPLRFQPVAKEEKQELVKRERDIETFRNERKNLEAASPGRPTGKPSGKADTADKPDKANKPDTKPDNKPDAKPDTANKPNNKPDSKPDTANKPDNKPDSKPDTANKPDNKPGAGSDKANKPDKANLPKSPIVAKPAEQLDKGKAPPKRPEPPAPDPKVEAKPKKDHGGRPDPPQANPKDDSTDKGKGNDKDNPKGKP